MHALSLFVCLCLHLFLCAPVRLLTGSQVSSDLKINGVTLEQGQKSGLFTLVLTLWAVHSFSYFVCSRASRFAGSRSTTHDKESDGGNGTCALLYSE